MTKPRLAVMASGSGTTAEAVIRSGQRGDMQAQVELIICSRRDAGIFERVRNLNAEFGLQIECLLINSHTHPPAEDEVEQRGRQTMAEEVAILDRLQQGDFDLIVNMGYMKLNGPRLVYAFGWRPEYTSIYQARWLNTHPGLLPESKGLYGEPLQEYVLEHHLRYAGQTLHVVAEKYDEGPVVAEHRVAVEPDDTPESLFAKVQTIEKQTLPGDIDNFIQAKRQYLQTKEE